MRLPDPREILTEDQAAICVGRSRLTLKKWRDQKKIRYFRMGSHLRYSGQAILDYLASCERLGDRPLQEQTPTRIRRGKALSATEAT